jgi:hypothetical protein
VGQSHAAGFLAFRIERRAEFFLLAMLWQMDVVSGAGSQMGTLDRKTARPMVGDSDARIVHRGLQ